MLDGVLSPEECSELLLIARCHSVVGYRAAVASCTAFELAAAEPALLLPLVGGRVGPGPLRRCMLPSNLC